MKADLSQAIRVAQGLCPTAKSGNLTAGLIGLVVSEGRAYVESTSMDSYARVEVAVENPFDCSIHLMPAPFRGGPVTIKPVDGEAKRLVVTGDGMRSTVSTIPLDGNVVPEIAGSGWTSIPHGNIESLADSIRWLAMGAGSANIAMDAVLFRASTALSSDGKSLHMIDFPDIGGFTCPARAAQSVADALDASETDVEIKVESNRIAIRSGNLFFSTYGTTQFKDIFNMAKQLLAGQGESYVVNTQELIDALRKCQQINPGHTGFGIDPVSGGTALITENKGSESVIEMNLISGVVPDSGRIFAFDPSRMLTTLQPFTKGDIVIKADTARTGSSVMNISSSDPNNTHRAAVAQMTWR